MRGAAAWGASDIVDIFAEKLNSENPGKYLYKGEYIDLLHRVERIKVKGAEDVALDVYRSVHGPIIQIDRAVDTAFAKHRAWDGRELDTLLAWLHATWAPDFDEWKVEAEKSAINVNMYFADVDGNIGYFHGGQFPERAAGHDNRFPVTGDGTMDWQGRQAIEFANPHVLNPTSGFLANWNNKPAYGVMNPDFFFYSWSSADRVEILHDALESQERFTPDEAWALLDTSSYTDIHARYFLPLIADVVEQSDDSNLREGPMTSCRPGVDTPATAMRMASMMSRRLQFSVHLLTSLIEHILSDDLGEVYPYFAASGYPTHETPTGAGTNIPAGVKAIVEAIEGNAAYDVLNGESPETVIAAALRDALRHLTKSGHALDELRLPVASRPFGTRNFLGIPQAGEDEILVAPIEQNRGTENNMIVMARDAIVGWEVTPPGQNAFIDPSGAKSEHYDDQFQMYHEFGKKRMWFYSDDVKANKSTETLLSY